MIKFFLSLLLGGLLVFCFSQDRINRDPAALLRQFQAAEQLYRQAEKKSLQNGEADARNPHNLLYRQTLSAFLSLLAPAKEVHYDSLSFFIHLNTGFIFYHLDNLDSAKKHFRSTISLKQKLPGITDSLLIKPFLLSGNIYFKQHNTDSAILFYKKAEQIINSYRQLPDASRVYNRLGEIYSQNGDYPQAKYYFEKAIAAFVDSSNKDLLATYKFNKASLLMKLEEYQEAKPVFESILTNNRFRNEVYHNLGIIELHISDPVNALPFLRKVRYKNDTNNIKLLYNFVMAFSSANEPDSIRLYLDSATRENKKWNGPGRNISYGNLLKYEGDQLVTQGRNYEAIQKYQQAIMQFDTGFNEPDIYQSPSRYDTDISFVNLFNTLLAKAMAFENLHPGKKNIRALDASLNAYRSALRLADFIKNTYDHTTTHQILDKIKDSISNRPVMISLELYELTKKVNYLEDAYLFDQQAKAIDLSLNLQKNELPQPNEVLREELDQRSTITRLSFQASQIVDSGSLQHVKARIRVEKNRLNDLQKNINADPVLLGKGGLTDLPSIASLQKQIDSKTAIVSFHLSGKALVTLVITSNEFGYNLTSVQNDFLSRIDSFRLLLRTGTGQKDYDPSMAMQLYKVFIAPIYPKLTETERLIIIPGNELDYLPFEALQDENKKYLIENFSIQYQYSTALLGRQIKPLHDKTILAFAPFVNTSYRDSSNSHLASLPTSKQEINEIAGKSYIDSSATRNSFLSSANSFNILHLATHTCIDNTQPLQSFIAFYPGNSNEDFKLYTKDIYQLRLDSVRLIFLSSCETDSGQLNGKGLLNLSRAFAYAGCPNMIASLWKSGDEPTIFITKQFYNYINSGYSRDKALQKARLDLLESDEIDSRFKTPPYWANFVLIGQYEPMRPVTRWLLIAAITSVVVAILLLITVKSNY